MGLKIGLGVMPGRCGQQASLRLSVKAEWGNPRVTRACVSCGSLWGPRLCTPGQAEVHQPRGPDSRLRLGGPGPGLGRVCAERWCSGLPGNVGAGGAGICLKERRQTCALLQAGSPVVGSAPPGQWLCPQVPSVPQLHLSPQGP